MHHVGIDYHKKYSVFCALNDEGERVLEGRIQPHTLEGFSDMLGSLGGPLRVTFECGMNWGFLYDILEEIKCVEEILMAHPYHLRLIAESQIKTDKLDARKLATLLRANVIPTVYAPSKETRNRKLLIRQRISLVKQRTRIRNRIHQILGRQRDLELPQLKNLFGVRGLAALRKLELSNADGILLEQELALFDLLNTHIKHIEKGMREEAKEDWRIGYLSSIPGVGLILASIIALEIDEVSRFRTAGKFCSYAGLVPRTYSSGGKTSHGPMLSTCNKWLKWAFIEAAWVAICNDGYLGSLYTRSRARGKKANVAVTIVAHRMAEISYRLLKEKRSYTKRGEKRISPGRPDISLAVDSGN